MLLFRKESFTITGLCDMVFHIKFFCTLMRFDNHQYVNLCCNLENRSARSHNSCRLTAYYAPQKYIHINRIHAFKYIRYYLTSKIILEVALTVTFPQCRW